MVGNRFPSPENSVRFAGDPLRGWTRVRCYRRHARLPTERGRLESVNAHPKQLRCCGRMPRCQRGRASSILASCTAPEVSGDDEQHWRAARSAKLQRAGSIPALVSVRLVLLGGSGNPILNRERRVRIPYETPWPCRRIRRSVYETRFEGSTPSRAAAGRPRNRDDVGNERRPIPGSESVRLAPSRPWSAALQGPSREYDGLVALARLISEPRSVRFRGAPREASKLVNAPL
jgi:hypothetical protein